MKSVLVRFLFTKAKRQYMVVAAFILLLTAYLWAYQPFDGLMLWSGTHWAACLVHGWPW